MPYQPVKVEDIELAVQPFLQVNLNHDDGNMPCTCGSYMFHSAVCGHIHTTYKHCCGASISTSSSPCSDATHDSEGESKPKRASTGRNRFCYRGAGKLLYTVPITVFGRCKKCDIGLTELARQVVHPDEDEIMEQRKKKKAKRSLVSKKQRKTKLVLSGAVCKPQRGRQQQQKLEKAAKAQGAKH
jgi:hypothetical protein